MPWTNKQKQLAVRGCKGAGIDDDQRRDVLLRNFAHAHEGGRVTSTAAKLNSRDFEAYMAILERMAGGTLLHFSAGYWARASADSLGRMRYRARKLAAALEAAGKLESGGVGLAGWITRRVAGGIPTALEDLEYHGLMALIVGLESYAKQNAVNVAA
jgi:hypothetical protein